MSFSHLTKRKHANNEMFYDINCKEIYPKKGELRRRQIESEETKHEPFWHEIK